MEKDFDAWHRFEDKVEGNFPLPHYREGEIWWCSLGVNIGREEDGKNNFFERPILVLRRFNKDVFWGLPMSSTEKVGQYNHSILFRSKRRNVLLSQLRILSSKRLIRRIGVIDQDDIKLIEYSLLCLLLIKNGPSVGSSGALRQ